LVNAAKSHRAIKPSASTREVIEDFRQDLKGTAIRVFGARGPHWSLLEPLQRGENRPLRASVQRIGTLERSLVWPKAHQRLFGRRRNTKLVAQALPQWRPQCPPQFLQLDALAGLNLANQLADALHPCSSRSISALRHEKQRVVRGGRGIFLVVVHGPCSSVGRTVLRPWLSNGGDGAEAVRCSGSSGCSAVHSTGLGFT
jgi:hypothetical protein